jgi:hypothetical protein
LTQRCAMICLPLERGDGFPARAPMPLTIC